MAIGERVDGTATHVMDDITTIDMEGVQELMIAFGRKMESLGYDFVLEEITGTGDIGTAVANPETHGDVFMIAGFLKEVAKELLDEPQSEERDIALKDSQKAWNHLKTLVR